MAKKETDKKFVAAIDTVVPFVLAIDDPFAEGVLRTYRSLTGKADLKLPCVLPCGEENSTRAVENYLLRSSGGGDRIRAQAALDWLKNQPTRVIKEEQKV